jgi:hypothetical protein
MSLQSAVAILIMGLLVACSTIPKADLDLEMLTAARAGNELRVRELLASGTSANGAVGDRLGGALPLVEAIAYGHPNVVPLLISAGAETNKKNGLGNTPLIVATGLSDRTPVKALLHAGANPNIVSRDGWGPLQIAARSGKREIVQMLLDAGAQRDLRLPDGNTALSWARVNGYKDIETLLRGGQ